MKKKNELQSLSGVKRFNPRADQGLSDDLVRDRTEQGLVNADCTKKSKSYLNIVVGNFCTFFNLLGLIVAIALIIVKAPISDFVFVLIFFANILIGLVQEIRAKRCVDKLSLISAKNVNVIRNGEKTSIPPNEIVLDDVLCLELGSQIATDGIILDGTVEVNESLLTGESVPVKKSVGDPVYSGSFIVGGNCRVRVDKVGKFNYVNTLSEKAKKYKKPNSEIMRSLRTIIKAISIVIIPLAIIHVFRSTALFGESVTDAILGTSTLIIGMIPAGMFLLTSMALAVGILKLATHNTLVQDLYSLEMLARVDTICFDKTGTLTDGKMIVRDVVPFEETDKKSIDKIVSSMLYTLQDNNQTSIALYERFGQTPVFNAVSSIPFSSVRKFSAVTFDNGKTYAFGAPEFVLNFKRYENIKEKTEKYARSGLRVLVLAESEQKIAGNELPDDFTEIALIILADNVREEATSTVKWFQENDIEIKVISGDNPITVSEVAKRTGIKNYDKYISLDGLSDKEVYEIAEKYTVFGRVSPEQKAILVKALKNAGHSVAMTGDGVNDILAMKEADCAVAVATGSDAAKNVSHIVLLDNNFDSMPKVVEEGRRVINNVEGTSSLYLMKTLFTMTLSILVLFLPTLKTYPFRLNQMILLEVFIIGLPSFFLSLQPNSERVKGNFIKRVLSKSLPSAALIIISFLIVEIFRILLHAFPNEVYVTLEVYAINITGLLCLFKICSPLNKYRGALFAASAIIVLSILTVSLFNGFPAISLVKMSPVTEYWHHLLILLFVILIDVPLYYLFYSILDKKKTK